MEDVGGKYDQNMDKVLKEFKKKILKEDSFSVFCFLSLMSTAVFHSNVTDWFLMVTISRSSIWFKFLVSTSVVETY